MNTPLISVIMAAYKEPLSQFSKALNSVLMQTYKNLEVVLVIDDPDNVCLIEAAQQVAQRDGRIKLLVNDTNVGLAESLNRAIDVAQGEYLCRMDSDDISLTDRIKKQLEFLVAHEYDLVGGQVDVIDENGNQLYGAGVIPANSAAVNNCLRFNNSVPHPTWFGKREVFIQKYRNINYCEDYDFLIRAALDGCRMGNLNEVVLMYRMSKSSISRDNLYRQFLSQVYLTKMYRDGRCVDPEAMQEWIESNYNERRAHRYERANVLFNDAMMNASCGKKTVAFLQLIRLPLVSVDYLRKLYRIARVKLASRG